MAEKEAGEEPRVGDYGWVGRLKSHRDVFACHKDWNMLSALGR